MLEGEFTVSCGQCGGEDFEEVFPVPAETYRQYVDGVAHELTAAVYVCCQCGHLEKFVDLNEKTPPPQGGGAARG